MGSNNFINNNNMGDNANHTGYQVAGSQTIFRNGSDATHYPIYQNNNDNNINNSNNNI